MTSRSREQWVKRTPGRRIADKEGFAVYCMECNLRKEVESKMSWRVFTLIMSILLGLLAVGGGLAGVGFKDFSSSLQTSIKDVQHSTQELVRTTERIETQQVFVLRELGLDKPKINNRNLQ